MIVDPLASAQSQPTRGAAASARAREPEACVGVYFGREGRGRFPPVSLVMERAQSVKPIFSIVKWIFYHSQTNFSKIKHKFGRIAPIACFRYNMGGLARFGEELRQRRDGTEFSFRVVSWSKCFFLLLLLKQFLLQHRGQDEQWRLHVK